MQMGPKYKRKNDATWIPLGLEGYRAPLGRLDSSFTHLTPADEVFCCWWYPSECGFGRAR